MICTAYSYILEAKCNWSGIHSYIIPIASTVTCWYTNTGAVAIHRMSCPTLHIIMSFGLATELTYVIALSVPFCLVNQPPKVCIRASFVKGFGPRPFPGGWGFISQSMHFEWVWV